MTVDEIKYAAADLTPKDRRELAHFFLDTLEEESTHTLTDSLNGFASAEIRDSWMVEIQRRIEELDSGKVKAIPGDEVMQRLFGKSQ